MNWDVARVEPLDEYTLHVELVDGHFLDAEAGLYRIRRDIDDRIEPVLLEMGEDRSGLLDTVLRTGKVVYERSEASARTER